MLEALMGWINHDGRKCPCVGEWVDARYEDGDVESGIASDTLYWHYVTQYRLIAPPIPQ